MDDNLPSRSQRRKLAKKLGLIKKETFIERSERIQRSLKMGNKIHMKHLENIENKRLNQEESKNTILSEENNISQNRDTLKQIITSGETPE